MIAKAIISILITILLPDAYLCWRFLRRRSWWVWLLWIVPGLCLAGWSVRLALQPGFVGDSAAEVEAFLLVFALFAAPKALFALCSLAGRAVASVVPLRKGRRRRNYGNLVGLVVALMAVYIVLYGAFVGFYDLQVRRVEVRFSDLPPAFDGYRIVHFSDAHVGTLRGARQRLLRSTVDSILAQNPNLIAFTGDLQNTEPQDLYPHLDQLARLHAPDGVYAILGNHDYDMYIAPDTDPATRVANCRETARLERHLGWTLLNNANHRVERHGNASIVIAGMENDGQGRFPQLGSVQQALSGVGPDDFVVMLEHDPTSWRRKILSESHAQLTLSGHTHGAQFSLLGWSPASLTYKEWGGLYQQGNRCLNVTVGMGALIPFRFGMPPEIVVITLRKQ